MSPRGVAVPELRQQLFAAAERVLLREGPGGLSGRAITREAGVATGLLYNHFHDLDSFLIAYLLDRSRIAADGVTALLARAGQGTVTGNLTDAALVFGSTVPLLAGLVRSRPELAARLHDTSPSLEKVEGAITDYLEAEKALGRVATEADVSMLALALVSTVHRMVTDEAHAPANLPAQVRRVVVALIGGS